MPISFLPVLSSSTSWGNINGNISDQNDLKNSLDGKSNTNHDHDSEYAAIDHEHDSDYTPIAHSSDTSNPHSVTASQVGLGNVTNDAQLKRSAGDINSFSEKTSPVNNDLMLIEDSEDSNNKKKVKFSSLPSGGGSYTPEIWKNCSGSWISANSFSFSGSADDAKMIEGSLFACKDSTGTTRRIGYVKNAVESSGTVTVTVVADTDLQSGDTNFNIALFRKYNDYQHTISIPGELVSDASNSQGAWLLDIKQDSYLLPVDSALLTAASGSGAACAWNVYKNSTNLFATAQDMTTNSSYNERRPGTKEISAGDNISLRVTNTGGDTNYPAGLQLKLFLVPQTIYQLI